MKVGQFVRKLLWVQAHADHVLSATVLKNPERGTLLSIEMQIQEHFCRNIEPILFSVLKQD
jgi:hypothetical protein